MKIFNRILYTIMTILIIVFVIYIYTTNILPMKYFTLVILVMLLSIISLFFLLFKKGKIRNIIGYVISFLLSILMSVIFYYLNSTMNFFEEFAEPDYKEESYLVLVLDDSEYQKIEELEFKNIGYIPNEITSIEEAMTKLNDNILIDIFKYEQYGNLFEDLNNKVIESVLVEESNFELYNEEGKYDNFRILYTVNIKTEIDILKEINVVKEPFTIYISGIDSYGKIARVSRSDVNMLATINPVTKQILLISVPRDYYVQLRGTTGYKDKLTHAGIYGVETSVGTLEDLLEIDINYYFRVNFSSLEKIVDALGGIDVYSKYAFTSSQTSKGSYTFSKGYNHMNGKQALVFSRERKNLPGIAGGDRGRGENQQAVIDGLIRKATSSAIITKYTKILESLKNTFQTNMTDENIQKMIKMQLNDMARWNITSYSLDGSNSSQYTYTHSNQRLYVMLPDEETVDNAKNLIRKVVNDEVLDPTYKDSASNVKDPVYIKPPEKVEVALPTITLVGDSEIKLSLNQEYVEQGVVISVDATDLETSLDNVVITGNVDVAMVGTYELIYTITDKFGQSASVTRTVIVEDPFDVIIPNPDEEIQNPVVPEDPIVPEEPVVPEDPIVPEEPVVPEDLIVPEVPINPEEPVVPEEPIEPDLPEIIIPENQTPPDTLEPTDSTLPEETAVS